MFYDDFKALKKANLNDGQVIRYQSVYVNLPKTDNWLYGKFFFPKNNERRYFWMVNEIIHSGAHWAQQYEFGCKEKYPFKFYIPEKEEYENIVFSDPNSFVS